MQTALIQLTSTQPYHHPWEKLGPKKPAPWKKWKKTWANGKASWVHGGKLTIVKMTFPSKVIYRFNAILIQNTTTVCEEMKVLIPGFTWNYWEPWLVKTILKKNEIGGLNTCQSYKVLQSYSKQVSCNWHKQRHVNQYKGTECLERSPYVYSHLILCKKKFFKSCIWQS